MKRGQDTHEKETKRICKKQGDRGGENKCVERQRERDEMKGKDRREEERSEREGTKQEERWREIKINK